MLTNLRMIRGYDETADTLLGLAKQFRERKDRKGAYTDVMNAVTPRVLRMDLNAPKTLRKAEEWNDWVRSKELKCNAKIHMDEKDLPF